MKCTSALLHCTSLINEPRIVDALLPNDSAVEPESATEQAETSAGPTVLLGQTAEVSNCHVMENLLEIVSISNIFILFTYSTVFLKLSESIPRFSVPLDLSKVRIVSTLKGVF